MTEKYGSFTDATWAPLRAALPSFAEHWSAYTAQPGYDPLYAGMNVFEFESHLEDVLSADLDSLAPLFVVMERLYEEEPALRDMMTINVLETLTSTADERGIDLRRIARLLPGPKTRVAWRDALTWTHRECTWDDERGLVPDFPPPVPVGRVRVTAVPVSTPDAPAFPVDGELLDGTIQPGHFVWKTLSSCSHVERQIVAVETLASPSESPGQVRFTLAYHESEGPGDRKFVGEMWYDPGEVLEIIAQVPPEMDKLKGGDPATSPPAG